MSLLSWEGLDDHRDALAAADAGGAEPVAAAAAAELMQQVQGDAGAAGAERVAERDGAAVHVGPLAVEAQLLLDRQVLRREGLVDLDQVHVVELRARPRASAWRAAGAGPMPMIVGSTPATPQATSRPSGLRPSLVGERLARQDQRRGAVADARGVAAVTTPSFLKYGRQLGQRLGRGVGAHVLVGGPGLGLPLFRFWIGDRHDLVGEDAGVPAALARGLARAPRKRPPPRARCRYCSARFSAVSAIGRPQWVSRSASQSVSSSGGAWPEPESPARAADHVRRLAHRLGAAGEHHLRLAEQDLLGGLDDGLEAEPQSRFTVSGRGLDREAGAESDVAGEVDGVGRGLEHVAEDHVVHGGGSTPEPARAARAATAPRSVAERSLSVPPKVPNRCARRRGRRPPFPRPCSRKYNSDHGPALHHALLGDDHDTVADVEVGPVEFGRLPIRSDADVVADAGVLVHDGPLDPGAVADPHRRRAADGRRSGVS